MNWVLWLGLGLALGLPLGAGLATLFMRWAAEDLADEGQEHRRGDRRG